MSNRVHRLSGTGSCGWIVRPLIIGTCVAMAWTSTTRGQQNADANQAVRTAFSTAFAKECTTDFGCGYKAIATSVDRQLAKLLEDPQRAQAIRSVVGDGLRGEIATILQATEPMDLKKPSSARDKTRAYFRFLMTSPLVGRSDREEIFKAAITTLEGKAVRRDSDETWRRWLFLVAIASAEDPERLAAEEVGILLRPAVAYAVKSRRWTMIEEVLAEKDRATFGVCQPELSERENAARKAQIEVARADLATVKEFDGFASRPVRVSILRDCSDASEFSATVWRSMDMVLSPEKPPAATAKALYEQDLVAGRWADACRWMEAAAAGKVPAEELWAPFITRWKAEVASTVDSDVETRSGMASVLQKLEACGGRDPHPMRGVTTECLLAAVAPSESSERTALAIERVLSRSGGMGMDVAMLVELVIASAERGGAGAVAPVWSGGTSYFGVADDGRRRDSFRDGMLNVAARLGAFSFLNERLARREVPESISAALKDTIEATLDREQNAGTPSEAAVLFYLRASRPYGLRDRWKAYLEGEGAYFRQRLDFDDAIASGDCRSAVEAVQKIRASAPTRSTHSEDVAIELVFTNFAKDRSFATGEGATLGECVKAVCAWRSGLQDRFHAALTSRPAMTAGDESSEKEWIDCLEAASLFTRDEIARHLLDSANDSDTRVARLRRLTTRWRGVAGLEAAWSQILSDATRRRDWEAIRTDLRDPAAGDAIAKLYFDQLRRDLAGRDSLLDACEGIRVIGSTMTIAGTDEANKLASSRLRQELTGKDSTPEFLDRLMMECGSWGLSAKDILPARRRSVELTSDKSPLLEGRVKSLLETSDRPDGCSPGVIRLVTRVLVAQGKQALAIDWAHAGEKQSAFIAQDGQVLQTVRTWVVKRDAEAKLYRNFTMDGTWTGTLEVEGATTTAQLTLKLSPSGQSPRFSPLTGTLNYDSNSVPVNLVSMNRDARTVSILLKEAVQLHALLDPKSKWDCELKFVDEVGKSIQLLVDQGSGTSKVTISLTRS